MQNSTLDAIFNRRSVRAYTAERVSDKNVALLAKAGLAAPSGSNKQPWHIVAVQNEDVILELERAVVDYFVKAGETAIAERNKSRGNKIFYNAATVFFIAQKEEGSSCDVGILAENICIAATSLGLGSIILGLPRVAFQDPDTAAYWKEKIGFPQGYHYGLAVAVGYSADEGAPHEIDPGKLSYLK